MNSVLRVLQIKDSGSDASQVNRLLEEAGYEVHAEQAGDAGEMLSALAGKPWDVIIADHRMAQFDAPGALRILHEAGLDIPFIVVSGEIGEGLAVAMMKSGAHDYLLKNDLTRLVPAVEREIREVTMRRERRQAEDALRQSEERLSLAINATGLGTFDFDLLAGTMVSSEFSRTHFGLTADAATSYETIMSAIHPDDRARVEQVFESASRPAGDGHYATECRTVGIGDGVLRWVTVRGRVFFDGDGRAVRFVGVTLDITERKRLEEQFLKSQKLESIGRLAGGVAHDFNNLLTVITGYSQKMLSEISDHHPFRSQMGEISKAASRAADLTRQLLTFSRRQISEPKAIAINDLVRDFEKMLARMIGEDIELVLALDPQAGAFRADPGQIEQVILNLVVNAKDAMPKGGRLLIKTSALVADEQFAQTHLSVSPGRYVALEVSDTGAAMPPEVMEHIFEPFFTTKEAGKGTGLGLSTVYGIVRQSEGSIWVYSEPGKGSTFKMLFPAVENVPSQTEAPAYQISLLGNETILLAEDDQGVRNYVQEVLEHHGYVVLETSNGREALEVAQRHRGPIHLLLADSVMPEISGAELADAFAMVRTGVPVLCMSGYSDRLWPETKTPQSYIQKPFTPAALLAQVRVLLDRP